MRLYVAPLELCRDDQGQRPVHLKVAEKDVTICGRDAGVPLGHQTRRISLVMCLQCVEIGKRLGVYVV